MRLNGVLVDTGFTGALVVPRGTFKLWGRSGEAIVQSVQTADGAVHDCATIEVTLLWLGGPRTVRAIELGHEPIIGMALLLGTRLALEADEVRIAMLPSRSAPARSQSKPFHY